jgi:glycosyltransferase involved in cell wall biosynthesis
MSGFAPKVSIIIPVYNGANYLREAIESALAQTYNNIEIVVVNDGSDDDGATETIAKSYSDKIVYIKKPNGGAASAINEGIRAMTGEYMSWLSHDDLYMPDKLKSQIDFLAAHQDKGVVLYMDWSILEDNQRVNIRLDHEMLLSKPKYSLLRDGINGITTLIPKIVLDDIGDFDVSLRYTQDYDYWHRVQKKYSFIHLPNIQTVTRIHGGQDSSNIQAVQLERDLIWKRMIRELPVEDKILYEGSERNFLKEMEKFLDTTPYLGARLYCKQELARMENKKMIKAKSSEFKPRVSIVIPVYNGSNYLGEAIDSALGQTYDNLEIIVVNDGSDDNGDTDRVAKSYGDKIRYFDKQPNGGASTALNLAIENMTGEYFSWLSHDDMYYPNKIQRQVEELAKLDDKNTIMMSDLDGLNEKREQTYRTHYQQHIDNFPSRVKSNIYPIVYNQTHGCVLLIPKVAFNDVGMFDVNQRVAQDFEFFYRLFKVYPHKLIPEVLVTARDTSGRMGRRAKPRASLEYSALYIEILKTISDKEVALLAKSRLEFLSNMWDFFRYAGYIQARDFASEMIINETQGFCHEYVNDFLSGKSGSETLLEDLANMKYQLTMVLGESHAAIVHIDESLVKLFNEIDLSSPNLTFGMITNLYELTEEAGYKVASSSLMRRYIVSLMRSKSDLQLQETLAKYVIGDDSSAIKDFMSLVGGRRLAKSKPTIAFSSTHWLTGGMERVMSLVLDQIKDKYNVVLITPYDGRDGDISIPEGVNHVRYTNSIFYTSYDTSLLTILILLNVDVFVGVYNLYPKQMSLYRLCERARIKTVASNHEYFFYPYMNYGLGEVAIERLETYKKVDAVIWPTNFNAAISGMSSSNNYVIANPNAFSPTTMSSADEKIVLAVGRFNDYIKRVDRILRAFKLIQREVPESKLVLVGDCDRSRPNDRFDGKSIDDLIAELDLDDNNIQIVGKTPHVDKYYKRASVLLLASDSEGFGMVINEAACFGVPTVANYIPGLEDLISDGKNGYLVPQDNLELMADKTVNLLVDKSLHNQFAKSAQELVKSFDAQQIGGKWEFLIDSLLSLNDVQTLRAQLESKIPYKLGNKDKLLAQLFAEYDNVSRKYILQTDENGDTHSRRNFLSRFRRSVRRDGRKRTAKKIVRKVYRKTKSTLRIDR